MNMVDLKKYKGLFWKKMKESEKRVADLPGFHVGEVGEFKELPIPNDISKIDVKYPLIEPFAYAHIKWDPKIQQVVYTLEEPQLTDEEKKILKRLHNTVIDMIQIGLSSVKSTVEATKYLEDQFKKAIINLGISLTSEQYTKLMYFIFRDFVGFNEIEPMLKDPYIEDIGCDGVNIPIYVVHRRYGSVKTNIGYEKLEHLREFVIKLAERTGRYISYAEPILDGTLPDGSRVNASLAGDVTTRGPTFSIRKFAERPFSPVDLIELGTVNPELMAYFWFLVESGASLMIGGGVATGKTTFLNSICMFIPPEAKIVSIEDTRELRLTHEHWIPTVSRLGFGIPLPTGEKYGEITLFDLLKGSFRQNPDYVIVGEVRGREAYVMFQGMSSVPGWERISLLNDTHFKRVEIGRIIPRKGFRIFSVDPKTERIKMMPIKAKFSHRPRKQLFKIKTKTGREVLVTSDHSLFTYTNRIEPIRADELSVGDIIAVPAKLPSGYNDIEYLNMLELFPDARVYAPRYVKMAVKKLSYERASDICGVKSISDYYADFKRSKPSALKIGKFTKLMEEAGIKYDLMDVYVRFDKKSDGYPGAFRLSAQLLRLMGYYVSEGSLNESGGNSRISFYNKDKKILEDIRYCLKRAVGFEPRERVVDRGWGDAVELSLNHKVLFELLKRFCGKKSGEKKIPEFVFGLNKEKIGHFLAGLYNGDGWFSKKSGKNYVFGYSTKSRELADDLLHLLLSFGIVATAVDRTKESKNRGYEILFYRRKDQHKFLKYAKLLKRDVIIGEILENPKIKNDVFLDKIKEIEVINLERETPVYDIAVSGTQNFIGGFGGVLLHNSGHPSFTTFHAGSVDTVIKRLTTPPIELSATLVESLDAIAIMVHAKERGKSARRIKTIEEIISVDPQSLNAKVFKSTEWDPATDTYKVNMEGSHLIEKLAHTKGMSVEDAMKEIRRRKAVLVWMFKNNIKDFEEVSKLINEFYKNPKKVLEKIGEMDLAKEEAEIEKRQKKIVPDKDRGELKVAEEKPEFEKKEMEVTTVKDEIDSDEDVYRLFGYKTVKEKTKAAA